jgi:hypothetical protein
VDATASHTKGKRKYKAHAHSKIVSRELRRLCGSKCPRRLVREPDAPAVSISPAASTAVLLVMR